MIVLVQVEITYGGLLGVAQVWTLEMKGANVELKEKSSLWDAAKNSKISGSYRGAAMSANTHLIFTVRCPNVYFDTRFVLGFCLVVSGIF